MLEVEFTRRYPAAAPRCRAALPAADQPFAPRWSGGGPGGGGALRAVVAQFRTALTGFQQLWDQATLAPPRTPPHFRATDYPPRPPLS